MKRDPHQEQATLPQATGRNSGRLPVDRCLVVGIVRNCARTIAQELARIHAAMQGVRDVHWFLVESDSSDQSIPVLERLSKEIPNFRYRTLGILAKTLPLRTARIAHCRNEFLKEIRSNLSYADIPFVVVCDLDDMNNLLSEDAFRSCWERDDWDVCTANQRGPYYDVWALRHPLWSPNDCWRQYEFLLRYNDNPLRSLQSAIYARMITIPADSDWIEVDSAFGGFAIYRREALDVGWYEGVNADGREQVEHVSLHAAIRSAGKRIFINPRLINAGATEHTAQLSFSGHVGRLYRYQKTRILNRLPWRQKTPWFDPFSGAR